MQLFIRNIWLYFESLDLFKTKTDAVLTSSLLITIAGPIDSTSFLGENCLAFPSSTKLESKCLPLWNETTLYLKLVNLHCYFSHISKFKENLLDFTVSMILKDTILSLLTSAQSHFILLKGTCMNTISEMLFHIWKWFFSKNLPCGSYRVLHWKGSFFLNCKIEMSQGWRLLITCVKFFNKSFSIDIFESIQLIIFFTLSYLLFRISE